MKERLLVRSMVKEAKPKEDDQTPHGHGNFATLVLVLSTVVALCGSASSGCIVSTITFFFCFFGFLGINLLNSKLLANRQDQ